MAGTNLTRRQIQMTILVVIMFMGGLLAYVFIVLPSNDDPVGSRRVAIVSGTIATLATAWFLKLIVDVVHDRKQGVHRGPAKVSRWFDIIFGAAVATGLADEQRPGGGAPPADERAQHGPELPQQFARDLDHDVPR